MLVVRIVRRYPHAPLSSTRWLYTWRSPGFFQALVRLPRMRALSIVRDRTR